MVSVVKCSPSIQPCMNEVNWEHTTFSPVVDRCNTANTVLCFQQKGYGFNGTAYESNVALKLSTLVTVSFCTNASKDVCLISISSDIGYSWPALEIRLAHHLMFSHRRRLLELFEM